MDFNELVHLLIGTESGTITYWQMHVRAVTIFAIGLVLIRLSSPRIFSQATPVDIIMSIIIGSNLSRTLTGNAPFFPVVSATIFLVALHMGVRLASSRWRPLANLVKGQPCVLVRDGEIDWSAMHHCGIGKRDLMTAIRSSGGEEVDAVSRATLERGGSITVVMDDD